MNVKHLASIARTGYTTISVEFPETPGRHYVYKAELPFSPTTGMVVVASPSKGYCLARVVEIHDVPQIDVNASFDYKWIVAKVDDSRYTELVEEDKEFTKRMREHEQTKIYAELLAQFPQAMEIMGSITGRLPARDTSKSKTLESPYGELDEE